MPHFPFSLHLHLAQHRRCRPVRMVATLALACSAALSPVLQAQTPVSVSISSQAPAPVATDEVGQVGEITQRWLDQTLQQQNSTADSNPLRMEVVVGALDARLRLAPCARIEPYLPVGARLWGRSRLGLRCSDGPVRWNVFLPLTVKAWGPAWVLAGNVVAGAVLTEADALASEVDWAADPAAIVADPALWVGQVAARALRAGQALRQSMLRAPSLFEAGAQVRVLAQGPGYAVTAAGQAMAAGAAGQTVRVRMANGKIVAGMVDEQGTVTSAL